ncbi:FecR family protein [Parabacteroides sp. GYB001]|uniref:FecR family protein n=1 Tax=Parabacteroides leei TaxID=2939491 RepID=UPI002016F48A|nr:FecR family protein [Parabacteroides leei]MCL3853805.1 FecR family protein [Parabacteroides leei]
MQDKDILFEELMSNYISGSITDDEKVSLFALVEGSDLYRERYNEMVKLYALLHVPAFESQKETRYAHLKERLHITSGATLRRRWFIYARNVAAVLLLMVSVSIGSIFTYNELDESGEQLYNEMTVPLGSQTKVILPDGSTVVLNSGSVLKYPLSYGKKERNVHLVGEGYFEVAKNVEKVFQVYAGGMQVKVTGTTFNLRSYPEDSETEVALINGGVDVLANNKQVRLKPDEKAIYNRETGTLYSETTESRKSSLWTTGRLSFVNASFLDILKDIERKYNIKIHVESKKAADEYFTGSINLTMSLQEVFNFIDVDKKYRFEQSGNVIMLKDR